MLKKGDKLTINGCGPLTVKDARWEISLMVSHFPHLLWVVFEEHPKVAIRFESDSTGDFVGLDKVE